MWGCLFKGSIERKKSMKCEGWQRYSDEWQEWCFLMAAQRQSPHFLYKTCIFLIIPFSIQVRNPGLTKLRWICRFSNSGISKYSYKKWHGYWFEENQNMGNVLETDRREKSFILGDLEVGIDKQRGGAKSTASYVMWELDLAANTPDTADKKIFQDMLIIEK